MPLSPKMVGLRFAGGGPRAVGVEDVIAPSGRIGLAFLKLMNRLRPPGRSRSPAGTRLAGEGRRGGSTRASCGAGAAPRSRPRRNCRRPRRVDSPGATCRPREPVHAAAKTARWHTWCRGSARSPRSPPWASSPSPTPSASPRDPRRGPARRGTAARQQPVAPPAFGSELQEAAPLGRPVRLVVVDRPR